MNPAVVTRGKPNGLPLFVLSPFPNCRTCFIISKGQKRLSCASLGFCPFGGEQSLFQSLEVEYPVTDVQIARRFCNLCSKWHSPTRRFAKINDLQYSICVFEALIWLKCLTEKQQQFVNQKTFSIFVVGKQSEKVFEYQTEKIRSTRRKRKNYCFDLGKLKENGLKTTDR